MEQIMLAIQQLLNNSKLQAWEPLSDIISIFFWDPITIPASNMPCICISPVWTDYDMRWNRYDQKNHSIDIKLVYNAKDHFKGTPDRNEVGAVRDSIKKIEKSTNQSTNEYTICWTIQSNTRLPYKDNWVETNTCILAKITNVSYWLTDNRWFPAYEVITSVSVTAIWDR